MRQREALRQLAAQLEGRGDRLDAEAAARLHVRTVGGAGCAGLLLGRPSSGKVRSLAKAGKGLFDGTVYTGEVAQKVGLVDGVGEMKTELQRRYGRWSARRSCCCGRTRSGQQIGGSVHARSDGR